MTALTVAPDGNATEVRFWQKLGKPKQASDNTRRRKVVFLEEYVLAPKQLPAANDGSE